MSAEFTELLAKVTEKSTVEESVVTLVQGIALRLATNPTSLEVTAMAPELNTMASSFANAVKANAHEVTDYPDTAKTQEKPKLDPGHSALDQPPIKEHKPDEHKPDGEHDPKPDHKTEEHK